MPRLPEHVDLNERYTVIVVGAGPAGVMAAREAAALGDVLLVDAMSFPRNKSCGGMLHEHSRRVLERMAPMPPELIRDPAYVNFRYVDWDRRIKKPTELRFTNVDRVAFDHWLLSLLPENVSVVPSCALDSVAQDDAGVTATLKCDGDLREVRCEVLVGADGPRSTVRRSLGVGSIATYVTLQDWVRLDGDIEPYFDCIYMRDIGDSYAYSYVVPKGDRAIIGSVYYPKTKRPHEKQDQAAALLRSSTPQLGERIAREAWVALYLRAPSDTVPGIGRVLLAGEAGGFMSPTSGEGISYALNSGFLAGRAIAEGGSANALSAYEDATTAIRRNIARKLRWLPFMESRAGKYMAGFVPAPIVSRVTLGL